MEAIKVVLGLGNPGTRYRRTRHNVGFRVAECLAERAGAAFRPDAELRSRAWQADYETEHGRVVLAKPRTYMNRSGRAAALLAQLHGAEPSSMLVVHDDADLRFGSIRIRRGGGAGGHNGLRSLIEVLGTGDFPRLKLGVRGEGRSDRELADYVLEEFEESEVGPVDSLVALAADAVEVVVASGLGEAMNRFSGRSVLPDPENDSAENDETR